MELYPGDELKEQPMFSVKSALAFSVLSAICLHSANAQLGGAAVVALQQDDAGIVVGEPLTAVEEVVEMTPLADGTTISKLSEVRKWRDAQGRFRRDAAQYNQGEKPVFDTAAIIDPVANTVTVIHFAEKSANVFHLPQKGQWSLHSWVSPFDKPFEARPGVKIQEEKLAPTILDGVNAIGRRVTRTRPAGTIGNDKLVVSVSERWISPDLKLMLKTTSTDPRMQEERLVTQIDRSVPDPNLFVVPPGFAIKEITLNESQK
jgi:hypothetical protein